VIEFSGEELEECSTEGLDAFPWESEKRCKGGRPTITDGFLAAGRNQWRRFFEGCWPEIGWPLLQIRKRRNSTLKDVQNVFRNIGDKPLCDHANAFLLGEPQSTTVAAFRKQRIASTKLRDELHDMRRAHAQLERACIEANSAVQEADEVNKSAIRREVARRRRLMNRNAKEIKARETTYQTGECDLRNKQTFLYCSEMLDFLRSGRRALTPKNLANALAGLPDMRWRQSDVRCSRIPDDGVAQPPYAVFRLIDRLVRRIGGRRGELSAESFQMELMKLPKKERFPRDFILDHRRDLRLAIKEVCKAQHEARFIPYALTSTFLRNVSRPKASLDSVLDSQERVKR
jgi:hypothetical protein